MLNRSFITALILCTTACATTSNKAAQVQVHSQVSNLLDECKKLGPVSATSDNLLVVDNTAITNAKNILREAAADRGGDTVAILNIDNSVQEVTIQGIAFKCY